MTKIGVIVLNYNSSADCDKCIKYLKEQEEVELDIIVVDNASRTEEQQSIKRICEVHGCTFIQNNANNGYNSGNNVGLKYAESKGYEYCLVANPDMEFHQKDYIKKLAEILAKDEKTVVACSDIVTPKGIHQNPMKKEGNWTSCFSWVKGFFKKSNNTYEFIDDWEHSHECFKVSGCAFLIKTSFLKEVNFFDEYPFLYCEEAILGKQVEQKGCKMYYTAESQAEHHHVASAKGNPIPRFRQWNRSRVYYLKEYSGYPLIGKYISIVSMKLYVLIMLTFYKIKGY